MLESYFLEESSPFQTDLLDPTQKVNHDLIVIYRPIRICGNNV